MSAGRWRGGGGNGGSGEGDGGGDGGGDCDGGGDGGSGGDSSGDGDSARRRGRPPRWRRRHGGGGAGGGEKKPRSPQLELSPAALWALMRAAHIALTAAHRARLTSTHRIFARYYVHLGCLTVSKGISRHRRRRALDAIDSAAAALGSTTTAIAAAARTSTASTPCPGCAHHLLGIDGRPVKPCRLGHAAPPPPRAARDRSGGRAGRPPKFSSLRCAWRSVDRPETESRTQQTRCAGRSSETHLAYF